MKIKLLFLLLFVPMSFSYGQSIQINEITPTAVTGGINVHLVVTTFNGAGYLSNSYTVTGNTIDLSVCYWFNMTLPIYQITNDFFIPVTGSGNYTINVSIINSSSATVCDNFSAGPTGATSILSAGEFETHRLSLALFPNPTSGRVSFIGDAFEVKNVTVFDKLGRLVKNCTAQEIDFTDLSEGIYIVKLETEHNTFTQKIVVKK